MSTRVKCRICGKRTRYQDGLCNIHRTLSPEQYIEPETKPAEADINKEESNMKKFFDITLKVLGVIFVIALLLFGGWLLRGCTATPTTIATETTTIVLPTPTPAPTEVVIPTETIAPTSIGIDQPSKSWFLAKAGTLISGDIAVFDNDNNSKKTPVYDSEEHTADIIVLGEDVYVWAEWGCYYVESPTQTDITNLINNKIADGYTVRVFTGLTKLGTNTPELFPAA